MEIIKNYYITEIKYESIKSTLYVLLKEVAYWRKANAIHNWFVYNVQNGNDDGGTYKVKKEQLEKLLYICEIVLNNLILADKLLPTKDGFFFGDISYNKIYVKKLEETVEQLEKILQSTDFDKYYIVYTSSW